MSTSVVYRQGVRPELFTVSSGAYASNSSFGAGATPQATYNTVTVPHGTTVTFIDGNVVAKFDSETFSTYRLNDDKVFFSVNMDFNINAAPPLPYPGKTATGSELRIRNLTPSINVIGGVGANNNPQLFSRSFPPPRVGSAPPTFRDVQIYTLTDNSSNAYWAPVSFRSSTFTSGSTGMTYDLGARLLTDDTLALYLNTFETYQSTTSLAHEEAITYDMFNVATNFGGRNATGSTVRLVIRGEYFCA